MSAKSARTLRSENEFIGSCVIIVNRFLLGSVCGKERLKAAVEIEAVTVLSTELVIELLQELTVAFQRDARSVVVLTCFDHNGLSSSVGLNFIWHIAIVPFARQRELVGGMRWVKRQIPASKNVKTVGTCWDPTTQTVKVPQCALTAAAFTRRWKMSVCERHYSGALKSERMEMDQIFQQMQHCPK